MGRWHTIDPLAEDYYFDSPYAYVGNSPLIFIDPDGRKKFSLNGSVGLSQGVLALGTEFIGGTWVPFGASEYKIDLSLSYDTESGNLQIGLKGSHTDIKAGAHSFATGAGGGTSETKTGSVEVEGGVNLKTKKLVGDAKYTPKDKEYKKEESGTVGFVTGSEKEGESHKWTIGIKKASVELFLLGANAGVNLTIEESPKQESTDSSKQKEENNQNKQ